MYKRRRSTFLRYTPYKRRRTTFRYGLRRTGGNYNQVMARRIGGRIVTSQGAERKFLDNAGIYSINTTTIATGTAGTSVATTFPATNLLNGMTQGTQSTQRIGRKIVMRSIQGRVTMTAQNAASGAVPAGTLGGQIRLLVFIDRQANGLQPSVADVMQDSSGFFFVQSPYNLNNRERFKIIYDQVKTIDPQNVQTVYFKFYKRLKESTIYNAGNAGTIADITTNSMYFLIGTNLSSTIGSTSAGALYFRLRFTDD